MLELNTTLKGFEVSDISELTGLTAAEIASLSKG